MDSHSLPTRALGYQVRRLYQQGSNPDSHCRWPVKGSRGAISSQWSFGRNKGSVEAILVKASQPELDQDSPALPYSSGFCRTAVTWPIALISPLA